MISQSGVVSLAELLECQTDDPTRRRGCSPIQENMRGTSAGGALLERHRSNFLLGLGRWCDRPRIIVCLFVMLLVCCVIVCMSLYRYYLNI